MLMGRQARQLANRDKLVGLQMIFAGIATVSWTVSSS